VYPTIPYFHYLNQDSVRISSKELKGKLWVVDFFFTTCSTICPRMTTQMKRLHAMTADLSDQVQFISFTINPRYDSPSILKRYRDHHGIKADNWVFLTGDEEETHKLGIDNFMVHAGQDEEAVDGYAHSEAFTLVDKEGFVRGVYNVSDPKQVDQMEKDIRKLLKYEYNIDRSK
jgi:protein SCO1/2